MDYFGKKTEYVAKPGINTTGLLLIVFIVLKLLHVIDWSWWWVLSPLWIPLGIVALLLIVLLIISLISK